MLKMSKSKSVLNMVGGQYPKFTRILPLDKKSLDNEIMEYKITVYF